ncbi:MAG: class I tRNA ligase family protein, partial [Eubacteriales bacterium]
GRELEYREYEPLFDFALDIIAKQGKKAYFVTCDTYVTLTDGTGIVHTAPAFGEDDARVGKAYDLPFVQLVDGKGEMTKETSYAGLFVKKADPLVLKDLEKKGLLFDAPKFEHSYPHCWRCDTPLIYYARESWYIRESAVKEDLLRNNATINWIPESIGTGRFGNWLENIQDWAISRNRYWGAPLNIWECECGHRHCVGSREELYEMSGDERAKTVELHRPYIDEITIKCPKCGKPMKRVPEVLDCWFDSGAMPFAQYHYPFENKELFLSHFPAQFISEAVDQTRGWFHSLLAVSTLVFNKAPYENVIVLGHVQDENGQKMSKSKGNAVDPFDTLAKHGADAIRWYFYSNSAPWLPNKFHDAAVTEGQRKFMGTLWNTYAFFVLYANIDDFDATKYTLDYDKLSVMDKWVLSKLNSLIKEVDGDLENYRITETARALSDFADQLSNWYVRRSRERFWVSDMTEDKINAYMTLYTVLVTFCKLAAPMIPFMTEDIYQNLVRSIDKAAPESIHLCDFPVANEAYIDSELEARMDEVLDIVVLGRACRNSASIKNRQPIGAMYIKAEKALPEYFVCVIADELNLKKVEFVSDAASFTSYSFKPQLRTVGPKYGKYLGKIRTMLAEIDGNAAMNELKQTGKLKLDLGDTTAELSEDDLLIESAQIPGFEALSDNNVTVALDTNLTPELIEEGFVREIVSKIQTMRKDSGFEVMDNINIYCSGNEKIAGIIERNADFIKSETLAKDIVFGSETHFSKNWNINGEDVILGVEKINK